LEPAKAAKHTDRGKARSKAKSGRFEFIAQALHAELTMHGFSDYTVGGGDESSPQPHHRIENAKELLTRTKVSPRSLRSFISHI